MNEYIPIIQEIPFFRHCTSRELEYLASHLRISHVKKNQTVDLKKINAINIILEGIFQLEVYGKKDYIYLTPGSFFGDYPFAEVKNRGAISAVSDAVIAHVNCDELYSYFIINYRFLRGYIRCLESLGIELRESGKELFQNRTKIIAVFSRGEKTGKSTIAFSLAAALSKHGKSVALDMSYAGTSMFDIAGKKITAPLSQKEADFAQSASIINSRIEKISSGFDMLNVVYGSRVKIDPSILSPLLLVLSKSYRYVVLDVSNHDDELRDSVFEQSDYIIGIISDKNDREKLESLFDSRLSDGQHVYYVTNAFLNKNYQPSGSLAWEAVEYQNSEARIDSLLHSVPEKLLEYCTMPRTALIMATAGPDALHYAWFLELIKPIKPFQVYAASAFAAIPLLLHLRYAQPDTYRKHMLEFLESTLPDILEVQFPRETLFRITKAEKYARSLARGARIEYYPERALLFFARDDNSKKIFSTGNISEMIPLSLSHYPLFPKLHIAGDKYHSPFPHLACDTEHLLRMGIEKIHRMTIRGTNDFAGMEKMLPWYCAYHKNANMNSNGSNVSLTGESNFTIDIRGLTTIEKISDAVVKQTNKFLKENQFV